MGAGDKTELITFERETRTRQPGAGYLSAWNPIGACWAAVTYASGKEDGKAQGAVRAVMKYKFSVYAAAIEELQITTADRIVWNGELFNIRERPGWTGTISDIEIVAESGVAQ